MHDLPRRRLRPLPWALTCLASLLLGCGCRPSGDSGTDSGLPPTGSCGDELIDPGETCDGRNLGGETCASVGFAGGTLSCRVDCSLDPSECHNCGNDAIDSDEVCDGAAVVSTCALLGFSGGDLGCTPLCEHDVSACTTCGDDVARGAEECDGTDLPVAACTDLGFPGGALGCRADCFLDVSSCMTCGNGVQDPGDDCDGPDLGGTTCASLGYSAGVLACATDCSLDTSGCVPYVDYSLETDGADDVVVCDSSSVIDGLSSEYTFELWFYWGGDDGLLVSKWGEPFVDGQTFKISIETSSSSLLPSLFIHTSDGPGSSSGVGWGLTSVGWHHLGYSVSPSCFYVVIDGSPPGGISPGCSGGGGVLFPSAAPLAIAGPGSFPAASDAYFAGRIDELRIWNVLRTDADMIAEMYSELTGAEPGLIAYFNFESGPGPTAVDLSPTGLYCELGTSPVADSSDPTWSSDVPF